ncbi:MAG TPA: hypothetical protein VF599_18130 [Pyrinomonadaceae bacterium]|jgi:hypothetical protein
MASKGKSTFKLIISEISAVGITVVPLALWFFEDYPVATVAVLYVLESIMAVIFAILCVLLLAPSGRQSEKAGKITGKIEIIKNLLWVFVPWAIFSLVFPAAVIVSPKINGGGVTFDDVIYGLKFILAFQLLEFFSNLYLLRPLSVKEGEYFLSYSLGGMAVIFVSIFLGFFAAVIGISIFLPFIVLKTFIDIGQPVQYFLGQARSPTEADPLFDILAEKPRRKPVIKRNPKLPT